MAYQKTWPRTISEELHEAWKKLLRHNDVITMVNQFGYSRPTIDKAFKWGNVTVPGLADKITKFFMDRIKLEEETSTELSKSKK